MASGQRTAGPSGVQLNRIPRTIDLPTTTAASSLIGIGPIRNSYYPLWVDLGVNLGRRILVFLASAGRWLAAKNFVKNFPNSHASRLTLDFGLAKLLPFKELRADRWPHHRASSGVGPGMKGFAEPTGNWGNNACLNRLAYPPSGEIRWHWRSNGSPVFSRYLC